MLLGIRTVVYKVKDLEVAKKWYNTLFNIEPYFDQPFYVGYNVGGYELGLDPGCDEREPGLGGSTAYWGVSDITATLDALRQQHVTIVSPLQDVGEGVKVASISDPFGNELGLIENPHFKLP